MTGIVVAIIYAAGAIEALRKWPETVRLWRAFPRWGEDQGRPLWPIERAVRVAVVALPGAVILALA
jgi:hypothetical protein